MEVTLFSQINASPSLKWVAVAIAFHTLNVFLGAYMGFRKKTPRTLRIHLWFYTAVLAALGFFLILNGVHSNNTVVDYLVGLYFITLIPLSKRWDVIVHAFICILGLLLLPVLILLRFF